MEILTENDLLLAVGKESLIIGGRKESCEGIKYDFTLSNVALTVDSKGPIDIDQSKENAAIKPGEIAFVMTKETLNLTDNIYCLKSKLDHDENWRVDFQTGLTEIKQLVKIISEKLETEVDTRQREINKLTKEQIELRRFAIPMSEDQKRYLAVKSMLITLVITAVGAGITYIIGRIIQKLLP